MTKAEYNQDCGLSKQEWELDNLADEVIASDSSLERIGILRKYLDELLRETETNAYPDIEKANESGGCIICGKCGTVIDEIEDDRPYCDECGKPLTDDELNIGTCEDCLCPE